MHEEILEKINARGATEEDFAAACAALAAGELSAEQTASLRATVLSRESSAQELALLAKGLRSVAAPFSANVEGEVLGVSCSGTGASPFGSVVAAALLTASAGAATVLCGSKSSSSCTGGTADVLKVLGIKPDMNAEQAAKLLEATNFTFIDYALFCPAVEALMSADATDDEREVFCSIVAPLINPAAPTRMFYGASDADLLEKAANAAKELGVMNGIFACGEGGIDEVALTGSTHVNEIASGRIVAWDTTPEDNALERCSIDEVKTATAKENSYVLRSVFAGKLKGPRRETVVLNGGAALMASGKAGYFMRALLEVRNAIDEGAATKKLEEIKKKSSEL